jgi:hypothetical protein
MKEYPYQQGLWNPYVAGIALGLVILMTIYIMGTGVGASGAVARTAVVAAHTIAPTAVEKNGYMGGFYKPGKRHPFVNWIFIQVIGVFIGGFLGALTGKRLKLDVVKGERASRGMRLALAFGGGTLWGVGTRFAMGCASGQAMTGGATMALGSWVVMMAMFAAAFGFAAVVRREWL